MWKLDLSDKIKRSFLQAEVNVITAICMHHMDAD